MQVKLKDKKINICLIGLMGSGKSMIGKEISKDLNLRFFDSDKEIEKVLGKTINNIFNENGEDYFRNIEEKICLDLLGKNNCVISLGGGSILSKKIREKIKSCSYSVFLKVSIEELVNRLSNTKKRPLLKNTDIKKKINLLYQKRKNLYNCADLTVVNNNKKDTINIIKKNIDY